MSSEFTPDYQSAASISVPWWSRQLRRIADRNPFYLISAMCMLGGCLAMTNSLSWLSLPLGRLLLLIGTINVYEAMLIGLALLLLGRGLKRDGNILLILEAFFLVDVTFLNTEVVTANLRVGILVSVLLFLFAAVKLALVMRAMRMHLSPASFVYVMAQVAALLAIPCVLRGIDHGSVSAASFYAVWWVIGLIPVVGEIAIGIWGEGHVRPFRGPAAVFVTLPLLSLIAHVGVLHYVYDVEYFGAMAAPLLLGLAILLKRNVPAAFGPRVQILVMRILLPLAAIIVSLNNPNALLFSARPFSSAIVTPTLLASTAAYLTYVYCFFFPLAGWLLGAGAFAMVVYLFGPTPGNVMQTGWKSWSWLMKVTDWMVPKTVAGWGSVSVFSSFFFLILGAAVSLTRPRAQTDDVDVEQG